MGSQDDTTKEFLIESYESLDRLDNELIALEEDPASASLIGSVFRSLHNIKGMCGFLEYTRLEALTHAGENLVHQMRDGTRTVNRSVTTALLRLVDAARGILAQIDETGAEGADSFPELLAELTDLVTESEAGNTGSPVAKPSEPAQGVLENQEPPDAAPCDEQEQDSPGSFSAINGSTIRVQVDQLDRLMNLAGELVLSRNQILQNAATSQDPELVTTAQGLNQITTELQEGIMKIRMQPIGLLWSRFPRLVRDLSQKLGKSIRLELGGKSTELDKTLLEAIKDPLVHLLRNAIDHGLETPEQRSLNGKTEEGTLQIRAFHESGHVNIMIGDDGKGIDTVKLRAKAVAQGLITSEEAERMSDRQALNLIFHSGLSTASAVTSVSGRGVGMDVVKKNIEAIGGTVEVASELGEGTTIRIKIPLTLAIIPALIFSAGGDRYAIPQVNLVELVRLNSEDGSTGIEDLHGSPVYRLRDDLLPLVYLDAELGVDSEVAATERGRNLIVLRANDRQFGLVVDTINDTEEIVVKALDRHAKSVAMYAGTTILGDGQVALILDVFQLATQVGLLNEDRPGSLMNSEDSSDEEQEEVESFLLFSIGDNQRMAVRLPDVYRLENFSTSQIEHSNLQEVIQYRGSIIPLIRLSSVLGHHSSAEHDSDQIKVVIHTHEGLGVGIVVDAITDIVQATEVIESGEGTCKSFVLDGMVTDLLDLTDIVSGVLSNSTSAAALDENLVGTEDDEECTIQQYCTFYLGDLYFAVDVMQVQEVLRHQLMTRVPRTSGVVQGLINLRGQTVTALDMRRRLGLPPLSAGDSSSGECALPMNVVLRSNGNIVSILVDRIGDVVTVEDSELAEIPDTVQPSVREIINRVYKLEDSLLLVLDIERVTEVYEECTSIASPNSTLESTSGLLLSGATVPVES